MYKRQTIYYIALLHVGIGETIVRNIFAVLNIPCLTARNLKKQERRVGSAIEKIATVSCNDALEKENLESRFGCKSIE